MGLNKSVIYYKNLLIDLVCKSSCKMCQTVGLAKLIKDSYIKLDSLR